MMGNRGQTRHPRSRRSSPSLAVAIGALILSLSGLALAIPNNSVKSKHIIDGEVKASDLSAGKNGKPHAVKQANVLGFSVTSAHIAKAGSPDVRAEAIGPGQLAPNTITGREVKESQLVAGHAIERSKVGVKFLDDSLDPLVSVTPGVGNWFALGSVYAWNNAGGNSSLTCGIRFAGSDHTFATVTPNELNDSPGQGFSEMVAIQGPLTAQAEDKIQLWCLSDEDDDVRWRDARLILLRAGGFSLPGPE